MKYAIVEAPSALGHVPEHRGVERAPEVLLGAGLADGLAARRAGRVDAEGYRAEPDPQTKIMNPRAASMTPESLDRSKPDALADRGKVVTRSTIGRSASVVIDKE